MPALDTNVLVRFLVRDDATQAAIATDLIQRCLRRKQPPFVPLSVMLELEWVLRSAFGFGKDELVGTLSKLLSAQDLRFESEGALEMALATYQQERADFADCLHVALAAQAGEQPLWTFDRAAARLQGAQKLQR
jgi:predicted nucleic-acid-binding protein